MIRKLDAATGRLLAQLVHHIRADWTTDDTMAALKTDQARADVVVVAMAYLRAANDPGIKHPTDIRRNQHLWSGYSDDDPKRPVQLPWCTSCQAPRPEHHTHDRPAATPPPAGWKDRVRDTIRAKAELELARATGHATADGNLESIERSH